MPSFALTLRTLNDMKEQGVLEDYAVAGAMALEHLGAPALWGGCLAVGLAAALGNAILGRLWRAGGRGSP